MKLLIRRYTISEVTKGSGRYKYYKIPGFLMIRSIWIGSLNRDSRIGEDVWVNATQLSKYIDKLKPDYYPWDWNPTLFYFDTVILGIKYPFQRPKCKTPGCNKYVPFTKLSSGYADYCCDKCSRTPGNPRECDSGYSIRDSLLKFYKTPEAKEIVKLRSSKISLSISNLWNLGYYNDHGDKIRNSWNNPNSGYNTFEYRELLSELQSNRWSDPNNVFNTPEFRKQLSERDRERWADPNDTFNQPWYREKISKITSDVMRRRWADPNDTFNSVEFRNLLAERGRERMRYIWSHPDEYPYFHEVQRKLHENGGLLAKMWDTPWLYNLGTQKSFFSRGWIDTKKGGKCRYMSSFELRFINLLEDDEEVIEFISQGISIKYLWDDGSLHRYIPDFLVTYKDGTKCLIEIKPLSLVDLDINQLKFKAGESYAKSKGWEFAVLTEDDLF